MLKKHMSAAVAICCETDRYSATLRVIEFRYDVPLEETMGFEPVYYEAMLMDICDLRASPDGGTAIWRQPYNDETIDLRDGWR